MSATYNSHYCGSFTNNRTKGIRESVTPWTNSFIDSSIDNFYNTKNDEPDAYVLIHAKFMSIMASAIETDDRASDISARIGYAYSVLPEMRSRQGTAPNVNMETVEFAAGIKERLILQLAEHEFRPKHYQLDDSSRVIEFMLHPSRLVFIVDQHGVQLLWRDGSKRNSDFINNDNLNFAAILQKTAIILSIPKTKIYRSAIQGEFALTA